MSEYDDILNFPHHRSKKYPPMSKMQRAAQFSAFAALRGYDEEIAETARVTEERLEPSEERISDIEEKLRSIKVSGERNVDVLYFVPDGKKDGGAYMRIRGTARVDEGNACLRFPATADRVPFDTILELYLD